MRTWQKINNAWKSQSQYRTIIRIWSPLINRNNSHTFRRRIVPVIKDRIKAWRCQLLQNVPIAIENMVSLLIGLHTNTKTNLQFRAYPSIQSNHSKINPAILAIQLAYLSNCKRNNQKLMKHHNKLQKKKCK